MTIDLYSLFSLAISSVTSLLLLRALRDVGRDFSRSPDQATARVVLAVLTLFLISSALIVSALAFLLVDGVIPTVSAASVSAIRGMLLVTAIALWLGDRKG